MEKADYELQSKGIPVHSPMKTRIIGKQVLAYETVTSTNEIARNLALEGQEEGTVIWARTQSAGYGRQKRIWHSPQGGLYFSVILRPEIPLAMATFTTLMGGASAAWTLGERWGVAAQIKWPNDVLVNGKKIMGVLTEMRTRGDRIGFIILGMGLNCDFEVDSLPKEIRNNATTLKHETGSDIDVKDALFNTLLRLDGLYEELRLGQMDKILGRWKTYQTTLGREVRIETPKGNIEGTAVDLDAHGALVVRTAQNRLETIVAGDCLHLFSPGR